MSATFAAAAQSLDAALVFEAAAFDALANALAALAAPGLGELLAAYECARHGLAGAVCEACEILEGNPGAPIKTMVLPLMYWHARELRTART